MVRVTRQNPTPESSPEPNPDIATIIAQQLQNIIPQIVTQVTTNVNNANGGNGNGGNNGCSYKTFTACNPKEFDGKGGAVALTRWIEKMESVFDNSGCTANQRVKYAASCFVNKALTWWNTQVQARGREAAIVPRMVTLKSSLIKRYINGMAPQIRGMLRATQPTTIQSVVLKAGILTNEAIRCGTLTKGNDKRKEMEESIPPRNDNVNTHPKCDRCYTFLPENASCKLCYNCQKPVILVLDATHRKQEVQQSHRDLPTRVFPASRVPLGLYSPCFCNYIGRRLPGDVVVLSGNMLQMWQSGSSQRTARRTLGASSSGHLIRSQTHKARVLCTYSGSWPPIHQLPHGYPGYHSMTLLLITSIQGSADCFREFRTYLPKNFRKPPIRDVIFNMSLFPGAEPNSKSPYRMTPISKRVEGSVKQELLS
ncbi:hypothetical protein Tco_0735459 [Tanacetum coccineum]